MGIWELVHPYVLSGQEAEKVEFKERLSLETRPERAEFARDVSALANTDGGDGYLIIGVAATGLIVGFPCPDPDGFRRAMADALNVFCDPPPKVSFELVTEPSTGKPLGIVTVHRSFARPHAVKRGSGEIEADHIWVRRGPACALANRTEIEAMVHGQGRAIVVNFSHPLSPAQLRDLRLDLNCRIEEVIERPVQFDNARPFAEQATAVVDAVGLTARAWQNSLLVVGLPGYAPGAAAILAELHGRIGHFPRVLRLRPACGSGQAGPGGFEFAEVMDLRQLRDESRVRRQA